jgi:putative DNA primase/helicase
LIKSPIALGTANRTSSAQSPWPKPQPLSAALPDVAPFQGELLPSVLRDHVEDISERLQVPADFPAATLLVTLAGAIGRRASITPLEYDKTWVVVPNLWGGLVGRPGLMKSPCIKAVMAPLRQIQFEAMQQYQADMEDYEREVEAWETRKAAWKKKAMRDSDGFGEPKPEKPACVRFIVNDATVEKVHEILKENEQGVLYIRDELAGWFATLDTKGRERDRPFFLESWNGDSSYTIDRIGRGTLHVEHLCLSVFGGIQPSRLQRYLTDAVTGGSTDDGLAQRLQVLVWPDHSQEWHQVDRPGNTDAAVAVETVFKHITRMRIFDPFRASFAPDAQELFNAWRADLEHHIRRGTLGAALESHLAKYRKLMPSIALILHLAESGESPEIPLCQVQRAAAWCDYLESHARRVYSCV